MKNEKLKQRTEMLLRKSRVFERPQGNSNKSPFAVVAITIAVFGIVSFFFLFFVISATFQETSESLNSKRFFLGFLLAVFQLCPTLCFAFSLYSESRKIYGTWISTKRTLFHVKPNGEYTAIDWNDVKVIEKDGANLVFQARHQKVIVPASGVAGTPLRSLSYLWFLNRLIEDYGRNREGSELLEKTREKTVCPFLYPYVKKSIVTLFFIVLFGISPALIVLAGLPFFYSELNAGRDPQQMIFVLQLFGGLVMLSPFLMLIPFLLRHPQVRKQALEIYENDLLPLMEKPLPRVSWDDYEKWQFGRKRSFTRYPNVEKIEQFLATIPPPPRLISPAVKRRFRISGATTFLVSLMTGLIFLIMGVFLVQGTEHSIREAQFWNWKPAGEGTIVKVDPVYKNREGNGAMLHVHDNFEFTFRNVDGAETHHRDAREFTKGIYHVGEIVPVRSFRGEGQFLRLDSSRCFDSSLFVFLIVPGMFIYSFLITILVISDYSEGPKKLRYWETANTGWGRVIGANLKGTTVRLAKPEGENATIFCRNIVYLGRENLWRPLAVFLDPENPNEGTTIQPLPFGLRIDPESGELVVDPKTRWVWPFAIGLVSLAVILSVLAVIKFFTV